MQRTIRHSNTDYGTLIKAPASDKFKTPFDIYNDIFGGGAFTSAERAMMALKNQIVIKPNWEEKIFDDKIVTNWRVETINVEHLSERCFNYMIDELREYAKHPIIINRLPFDNSSINISPVDNVYQSDNLINNTLRHRLNFYIETLKFPEKYNLNGVGKLDWHPDSNKQIIDLIHPSLFCYVKGVTKIKSDIKVTKKVDVNTDHSDNYSSKLYQWLPSNVQIDELGNAKFLSYINNLHPDSHKILYTIIENVLSRFVPMFDEVLTSMVNYAPKRVDTSLKRPDAVEFDLIKFQKYIHNRNRYTLKGKTVQVIVKAAQIILTPDNPIYRGGVWHVEGMKNENIVASGIYYYDQSNVSESKLDFRMAGYEPIYEQDDRIGVRRGYNLENGEIINNYLGYVATTNGRTIAFPNLYQHKVSPFSLIDKTQPGHRKILVFFLVDPNTKIISTSDVDPQQDYWYDDNDTRPDTVMNYEMACAYRKELMKERKFMVDKLTEEIYEREFSLCEH